MKKISLKKLLFIFCFLCIYLLTIYLKNKYENIEIIYVNFMEKVLLKDCKEYKIKPPNYIAHACGGFKNVSYTNSLEALNYNYNKGHKFIEIDIEWTKDNELVLIHDWEYHLKSFSLNSNPHSYISQRLKKYFNYDLNALSLEEFSKLKRNDNLTQMDLSFFLKWIYEHKDVYVVTDIKNFNIQALEKIKKEYPDVKNRIIPQIYRFDEYYQVKNLEYYNIILTLYMKNYSDDNVVNFAKNHKLFAVTMPLEKANGKLPQKLKNINVISYAHTINDIYTYKLLKKNGIYGVYTDFLNVEK